MHFEDFLRIIIFVFAIIFLAIRSYFGNKKKSVGNSSHKEDNHEILLKDLLDKYNGESDDEEGEQFFHKKATSPPQPKSQSAVIAKNASYVPRTVQDKFKYQTKYDAYQPKTRVEDRALPKNIQERQNIAKREGQVVSQDMQMEDYRHAYDLVQPQEKHSRAYELIHQMPSRKKMILLHEVFSSPKGLRKPFQ